MLVFIKEKKKEKQLTCKCGSKDFEDFKKIWHKAKVVHEEIKCKKCFKKFKWDYEAIIKI